VDCLWQIIPGEVTACALQNQKPKHAFDGYTFNGAAAATIAGGRVVYSPSDYVSRKQNAGLKQPRLSSSA
jgi:hypothetical protein